MDFASKTVLELRKIAREHNIKLSSGINKSEIIQRLEEALDGKSAEDTVQLSMLPEEEQNSTPAPDVPERDEAENEKEEEEDSADPSAEKERFAKPAAPIFSSPIPNFSSKPVIPVIPSIPSVPAVPSSASAPASAQNAAPAKAAPAKSGQPHYRSSWHNAQSSAQNKFTPASRQQAGSWNSAPARPQPEPARSSFGPSSSGFGPRFGPQSGGGFGPQQGGGFGPQQAASGFGPQQNTGFGPQSASEEPEKEDAVRADEENGSRSSFTPPTGKIPEQRTFTKTAPARPFAGDSRPSFSPRSFSQDMPQTHREPLDMPSIEELITPAECAEASGVLEVLPDGYGFLRSDSLLPSSHDLYVASSIVRRYELRSGDFVEGRVRPPRDGDKYSALLYVSSVNGIPAEELAPRTSFDDLTPVYSDRRLLLDDSRYPDIRLADLIAPIGFGNRALLLFPPNCGKREFMSHLADALVTLNESVSVIMLLLDFAPEEVTAIRDEVSCPVLATTFDQTPETQIRLIDLAQERAHRLAENGKDVVLIVDSLTRLVKTYSAASQSNRPSAGLINPSALFRAKKLFGAARCAREGGSLTMIATMDIETGNKLDDSIVEEFRSNANTEMYMDSSIARMGIYPPLHYQRSRSHRTELLLDAKEQEGLKALRDLLSSGSPANAVTQLLGLIDKVARNKDVLIKIINWAALMSGRQS